ncbi:MAG: magnesium transporter [Burkholderiales bacterium]|nr:MAG: magnesium transporter [Burkholderiales bacterium]
MQAAEHAADDARLEAIVATVIEEERAPTASELAELHPSQLADALESLPAERRAPLWRSVPPAVLGQVLLESGEEMREQLIAATSPDRLSAAAAELDLDKLADLYEDLPPAVQFAVMQPMEAQRRALLDTLRGFPEDSAGGLMDVDALIVRSDVTLEVVQRYLRYVRRRLGKLPPATDSLIVVDADGRYEGLLGLDDVVSLEQSRMVEQVMRRDVRPILATTSEHDVARLFEDRDFVSAPVVDDSGHVLGRITVDDVLDVIRDEGEHSVLASAGLDEEADMFAPVWVSVRRRALWLGVNLLNALIASWVIGRFGGTIEQMVALAILMPVVASMGGVAGTQTLTLVTRGIALAQVSRANARELLVKELGVAALNGAFWALVVGGVATAWFGSAVLGLVFGVAIVVNLVNGATMGTLIPLLLRRAGIDPALAGGVLLTALTDVIGFAVFLGLATAVLL